MKKQILFALVFLVIVASGAILVNTYFMNNERKAPNSNDMDNSNVTEENQPDSREEKTDEEKTQEENQTLEDINLANYNGIQKSSESLKINPEQLVSSHSSSISEFNSSSLLLNSLDSSRRIKIQEDKYFIERRSSEGTSKKYGNGVYEYERKGNAIDGLEYSVSQYDSNNSAKSLYPQERVKSLLEESKVTGYEVEKHRILLEMDYKNEVEIEKLLNISSLDTYKLTTRVNKNGVIESLGVSFRKIENSGTYGRSEIYRVDKAGNTGIDTPQWVNRAHYLDNPVKIEVRDSKITITDTLGNALSQNATISVYQSQNNESTSKSKTLNRNFNNVKTIHVTDISQNLSITADSSSVGRINSTTIEEVVLTDIRGKRYHSSE